MLVERGSGPGADVPGAGAPGALAGAQLRPGAVDHSGSGSGASLRVAAGVALLELAGDADRAPGPARPGALLELAGDADRAPGPARPPVPSGDPPGPRAREPGAPPHPTPWHELQHRLGGWPTGGLISVSGVGRTRLAMAALAPHLASPLSVSDAPVAWVDTGGCLFPPTVARWGIDLDRLLWVRPRGVAEALWATHVLLSGGRFGRVVLDLPEGRLDRRVERAVVRLERDAAASASSAFLLAADPVPGTTLALACREAAGGMRVSWRARRGGMPRQGEVTLSGIGPALPARGRAGDRGAWIEAAALEA